MLTTVLWMPELMVENGAGDHACEDDDKPDGKLVKQPAGRHFAGKVRILRADRGAHEEGPTSVRNTRTTEISSVGTMRFSSRMAKTRWKYIWLVIPPGTRGRGTS